METRITMIAMTIISSTIVKPSWRPRPRLPVGIVSAIRGLFRGLGVHIEDVLSAPTVGRGIVLGAAHAPVGGIGERVFGDAAQEADLLVHLAGELDAFD